MDYVRDAFEDWFCEQYAWEIKRGVRGRGGYHLDRYEGEYTSERAKSDWQSWQAACKFMKGES
jgi:hypothetical protein